VKLVKTADGLRIGKNRKAHLCFRFGFVGSGEIAAQKGESVWFL
jgi:hypothetical protein